MTTTNPGRLCGAKRAQIAPKILSGFLVKDVYVEEACRAWACLAPLQRMRVGVIDALIGLQRLCTSLARYAPVLVRQINTSVALAHIFMALLPPLRWKMHALRHRILERSNNERLACVDAYSPASVEYGSQPSGSPVSPGTWRDGAPVAPVGQLMLLTLQKSDANAARAGPASDCRERAGRARAGAQNAQANR
jgi:hypothetical protein